MSDLLQKLSAPFPPAAVSWRVGSTSHDKTRGLALAFIDARDVMKRLDEVVGPENWQRRYPWSDGKRLCCEIGIRIGAPTHVQMQTGATDEWIWKSDGAGDTDVEAEKGAFSDAFKRAAVSWGIGRYLYDLDSPWVELEPHGRSYKIKDSEQARLRAILAFPGIAQERPVEATKPAPQPRPAPAPTPAPRPVSGDKRSLVENVSEKKTAKGAIYEIRMADGEWGATFNPDMADYAASAKKNGEEIAYSVSVVKKGQYENRYITIPLAPKPAPDDDLAGMDELAGMP